MTTYVLILPAFTLDKEEAAEQGGIDVPVSEQSIDAVATSEDSSDDADAISEDSSEEEALVEEETEIEDVEDDENSGESSTKEAEENTTPSEVSLQNDASKDFTVSVEGTDAGLTEDMSVKVREIDQSTKKLRKEYNSLYSDALEAVQKEEGSDRPSDFAFAKFYDISLMDGKDEVEPDSAVDVKISFSKALQKELKVSDTDRVYIVHFAVDEETGDVVPEVLDNESSFITFVNNKVTEAAFTTDSFSVFAVVYTVDFQWTVDGKEYEYNLIGGSAVGLSELIEALGVLENTEYSTSENFNIDDFISDIETVEFSNEDLLKVVQVTEDTTVGKIKSDLKLKPEYSAALTKEQINEMDAKELKAPDWALFSMKSFTSDETLTIKMKDGEEWIIKVTDPVTDTAPGNMQVLSTADTRSQGIKMWLFDYDLQSKLDHQDNKSNQQNWNIPNTSGESNQYGNYGINGGSDLSFLGWGAGTQNNNATTINDFTGLDDANGSNHIRALQGIVKNSLEDEYPVLNDGTSLAYLFDPTAGTADRKVYGGNKEEGNINKLFEYKDGYYIYDSDEHYAELNGNDFKVYTSTLSQTNKNGNQHNPPRAVGFFPFDTYAHAYNVKYENDPNNYGAWGTLYLNPDGTNGRSGLNHHLGVAMEMDFVIPKGGVDENGNPIEFNFSGDDDMWVFIDDQLVLDIGGLHQPVDGTIDFSTGIATITGKATQAGHSDNTGSSAIATVNGAIEPRGNDFHFYPALNMPNDGDGKTHTMKIFYLERGGCDSNCMISFNLPLVKGKADVEVAKYDQSSKPVTPLKGVKFGLYSDAACTDLIEEVSSDADGLLKFENLGIKNDNQKYYLKEIQALSGYKNSDDVYTLEAAEDSSGKYYFKVMKNGQEIDTIGQEPAIPVINNEPIEPIELTVEKKWQDQNGNDIAAPADASATFRIQRYFRYEQDIEHPSEPVTFRVYRYKENNTPVQVGSDYKFKGGTSVNVNWGYANGYYNNNYSGIMHYKETPNGSYKDKTDPVTINLPESGEAAIYIRDENVNTGWGAGVVNITVNGTPYTPSSTTEHISTEWAEDTSYNSSSPTLTLPTDKIDDDHPWKGKFSDLKTVEIKDGKTYSYKYYIVETAKNPADSTVVYVDGSGQTVTDPAKLKTDQSGNQTIINKVPNGNLQIKKVVKYNNEDPPQDKQYLFKGVYTFTVCKDEQGLQPYPNAENPMTLTVNIGDDGEPAYSEIKQLPVGDYWIMEDVDDDAQIVPMGSNPQKVTISADNMTVAKVHTVTNNLLVSEGDDKLTLDVEKQFSGIDGLTEIPTDFQIVVTYDLDGEEHKVILKCGKSYIDDGLRVNIEHSDDGLTWKWHIWGIDKNSTNVQIKEKGYTISGYDHSASYNGVDIKVPHTPDEEQEVPLTANAAVLTKTEGRTTSQTHMGHYILSDDYVVLVAIPGNVKGTVVISKRSLNMAERDAITKGIPNIQNGPFTNKNMWFYSEEEHFIEGQDVTFTPVTGREFTFKTVDGEHIISWPPSSNKQAIAFSVKYGEETSITNAVYTNDYTEIGTDINIVKVAKGDASKKISGAKFTVSLLDEEKTTAGQVVIKRKEGETTPVFSEEFGPTDNDGKVTLTGLTSGYYMIEESQTPEGYVISTVDPTFYIHVNHGEITYLVRSMESADANKKLEEWDKTKTSSGLVTYNADTKTATVENEPGAALPNAGGPGTKLIYILGILLTGVAATGLIVRKRKIAE